jgi:hypothetical protein
MVTFRYGDKNSRQYELEISDEHVVVRTLSRLALMGERPFELAPVSPKAHNILK